MTVPVSVILPTYNRARLLPRAIDSVLGQSFTDFELIIVDDASQDETRAVAAAAGDERVRYLRLADNRGAAAARNAGIAAARGRYIAFQDSDDVWGRHKLARQMAAWESAGAETAVIYTQFWRQKGKRRTLFPPAVAGLSGDIQEALLWRNVVTTQAALARRDRLLEVGGFDERLPCLVDWELWLRLAPRYRFHFLAEPSVTVHFTPGSISVEETAVAAALCYILEKHASLFQGNSRLLAHHHYRIGHLRCMSGEKVVGLSHLEMAVTLAPGLTRYRLTRRIAQLGTHVYRQIYRWKTAVAGEWY